MRDCVLASVVCHCLSIVLKSLFTLCAYVRRPVIIVVSERIILSLTNDDTENVITLNKISSSNIVSIIILYHC